MKDSVLATDSLVVFQNSQGIQARGTLMRLSRNSAVFEVYNPYSIVQLSEVLADFQVRRGDRTIYTGRAVVSNLVSTGLLLIVSVTLVDPWSDLIDLAPGSELRNEVGAFIHDWEQGYHSLRQTYELSVSKIRNFLQELSRWLEHGEVVAGINEPHTREGLVDEFLADVDSMVAPKLDVLLDTFNEEASDVSEKQLVTHKAYARRELHPLMLCSPFLHRSYTKPLGYAGDYEMVNMILKDAWMGSNTYAKVIDSFFLRNKTAEAHRNRVKMLTGYLTAEAGRSIAATGKFRVLNIGCGPAFELINYIKNCPEADLTEIKLLDFNEETLSYAKTQIDQVIERSGCKMRVEYAHQSIHQLLKEASARRENQGGRSYDMVYCAGLFDYLSDRICGRLLKLFYRWTVPGGFVLATNVHSNNPIKGVMEHLAEWYLVLRDENDMRNLTPGLGQQVVLTEDTGVNIFIEIRNTRQPIDSP